MTPAKMVILYGVGGLSDVGRHAVKAALERSGHDISNITVLTRHPEKLEESNWNCGCETPHSFTDEERKRFQVVPIQQEWKDADLTEHMRGASAVVSCLGNRQPFIGHWDAAEGNKAVIDAIRKVKKDSPDNEISRVVALTSVGVEEDWPPMEYFPMGKYILGAIFTVFARTMFRDLTEMEKAYKATPSDEIDYLLVRPVGIGEDAKPINEWFLQKEKYKDILGLNMAKMDAARYMVEEALSPTKHREAVVLGSDPKKDPVASKILETWNK